MDRSIAIDVDNVSKKYCKSLKRSMLYGMCDIARNTVGLGSHSEMLRKGEFWAVRDVSFEVRRGETVGLVGPNGAGKTTLLKMLNGIFWPDKGRLSLMGRVGALIAVGAGFHPLFTGKENIFINGAILGMSRQEVEEKFDAIVEFADIGDFLDVPVKYYSSGMFVRLGFSVAIHCEPDILLVDEVLAVGDIEFQNKCLQKISEIRDDGCSIVLVSHNINTLQLMCDNCILLFDGKISKYGKTRKVLDDYAKHAFQIDSTGLNYESPNLDISISDGDCRPVKNLLINREYRFEFTIKNLLLEDGVLIAFAFQNMTNNYSYRIEIDKFAHLKGMIDNYSFLVDFDNLSLPPGEYTIRFSVSDGEFLKRIFHVDRTILFAVVETDLEKFLKPIVSENEKN